MVERMSDAPREVSVRAVSSVLLGTPPAHHRAKRGGHTFGSGLVPDAPASPDLSIVGQPLRGPGGGSRRARA